MIFLDGNNHEPEFVVTRKNASTREEEAAAGLTLRVKISATKTGDALGTLDAVAAEAAGAPGTYFASFAGAAVESALRAYLGQKVWEILYDAADTIQAAHPQEVAERVV